MKNKQIYILDDGTPTPIKAEYIRQEFMKGKTRRQLADELGVSTGIVAGATANMDNGKVRKYNRTFVKLEDGRVITRAEYIRQEVLENQRQVTDVAKELKIKYDSAYASVRKQKGIPKGTHGGKIFVKLPDGTVIPRVDYIRSQIAKGISKQELMKELGCDYHTIYVATYKKKVK